MHDKSDNFTGQSTPQPRIREQAMSAELTYRIEVVLPRPLTKTLSYLINEEQQRSLQPGCQILVPLGKTVTTAYVATVDNVPFREQPADLKRIIAIVDEEPILNTELLQLTRDTAHYYQTPWGLVIKAALPPGIQPEEIKRIRLCQRATGSTQPFNHTDPGLEPVMARVCQLLMDQPHKDWTFTTLQKKLTAETINWAIIKKMAKKGLIDLESDVQQRTSGSRKVLYRLALNETAARKAISFVIQKAPRKAEIMERLIALGGETSVFSAREVNALVPGGSRYLAGLVTEGFLVATNQLDHITSVLLPTTKLPLITLMAQQQQAYEAIIEAIDRLFRVFLVHGVTGSGKTEVYLKAAEYALGKGLDVLVLVPEIGLTPAMITYLATRFPGRIVILHSGLEKAERLRQWYAARAPEPKLVLGTRSAVFAPLPKPGLIIVDEEHDTSFKQETNPMYNARDVAILRAYSLNCPIILGSATPSMESYLNAQQGKYQLITMPERVDHRPLPPVTVLDMRRKNRKQKRSALFSDELLHEMDHRLAANEQVLLFTPRRGYSHSLHCHECGHVIMCDRCSVSLTFHKYDNTLKCHYCGRTRKKPLVCPECKAKDLKSIGIGTQAVEEEVRNFFPGARIARIDTDSTRGQQLYKTFRDITLGNIDVIIGTQMVTKGHDFRNITLVGVLAADSTLYLPDFRAAERTFQLLTQVAGRTGRGQKGGLVMVQTLNPDHHCIDAASHHDYLHFYRKEIPFRQSFRFPPFRRMAQIILSSPDQQAVIKAARAFITLLEDHPPEIECLGPAPAPISLLKGKYRWQIIVKARLSRILGDFLTIKTAAYAQNFGSASVLVATDIDPIYVL